MAQTDIVVEEEYFYRLSFISLNGRTTFLGEVMLFCLHPILPLEAEEVEMFSCPLSRAMPGQ